MERGEEGRTVRMGRGEEGRMAIRNYCFVSSPVATLLS